MQPQRALVELDAGLGAAAGERERLDCRCEVVDDERAHRHIGRGDAFAAVTLGEDRARLTARGAFATRLESASTLPAVGVAEHDLVDELAALGAATVDVLGDPLTRAGAVGNFIVHGRSTLLCQGLGRLRVAGPACCGGTA